MNVTEIREAQIKAGTKKVTKACQYLGTDVVMHAMSATMHEKYIEFVSENPYLRQAKLLQVCMFTEDGKRIWSEKEVPILGSYRADEDAVSAALVVNGWGSTADEEILKNSSTTSGDDGASEQPENTESPSPSSSECTPPSS